MEGKWLAAVFAGLIALAAPVHAGKPTGNQPPTVSLTAPASGASYAAPATIDLTATAADTDGTIGKVEFYAGTTLLGSDTTSPYGVTWSNVQAGSYSLTAKAYDNANASATSAAVSITVGSSGGGGGTSDVVISSPAEDAHFSSAGSASVTGTFVGPTSSTVLVDNGNQSVVATLTGNQFAATLPLSFGENTLKVSVARPDKTAATATRNVTYDPESPLLAFTGPAVDAVLELGKPVTLAAEAVSEFAPSGQPPQVQFFQNNIPIATAAIPPYWTSWTPAAKGPHTLRATATDAWGVSRSVQRTVTVVGPNVLPTATLVEPAGDVPLVAGTTVTLKATASDSDGTVMMVAFYQNGQLIGVTNVAPYTIDWLVPQPGDYVLTVTATDDRGGVTTSPPVSARGSTATAPPLVTLTSPAPGSVFYPPTDIVLTASAIDPDSTILKVEFYTGTTLIGAKTTPPFSVTWTNPPVGTHTITIKAIDDSGVTGMTSATLGVVRPIVTYQQTDFLGSPIAATDEVGNVLWKDAYTPYGVALQGSGQTNGERSGYTGKPYDSESGLNYYGARYYDPASGRFMSIDPVGFSPDNLHSFNRYAYANNNPYRFVDPDGRDAVSIAQRVAKLAAEGIEAGKLIARRAWRKDEKQAIDDAAEIGPNGGKICPECKNEVEKLDINHTRKWGETQHEILDRIEQGEAVTRAEVRDMYGKHIDGKCPSCNRADNKLSLKKAGAAGGIFGLSWEEIGNGTVEFIVPGGVGSTGGCNSGRCSDTYDGK